MTVRADCAVSAGNCLPPSKKLLPTVSEGESATGQEPTLSALGASTQNKANFSFHQPGFLLVFEQQATGPGFGNNISECSVKAIH